MHRLARADLFLEKEIREFHHPGDGRVERHLLYVVGHDLDGLVQHAVLLGRGRGVLHGRIELHGFRAVVDNQAPDAVQKVAHTAHAVHAPGFYGLQRAHEHLVQAQGVCPVFGHNLVGIDHVAAAFRHLVCPAVNFSFGVICPNIMSFNLINLLGRNFHRGVSMP